MEDQIVQPETAEFKVIHWPALMLPAAYDALIYSKWLRSYRFGNPLIKRIVPYTYYMEQRIIIKDILESPHTTVILAVLGDDDDVVLGFCVHRKDILDYIFVHQDYRRNHIAKALMPPKITVYTHVTATFDLWNKNKDLLYNPYI